MKVFDWWWHPTIEEMQAQMLRDVWARAKARHTICGQFGISAERAAHSLREIGAAFECVAWKWPGIGNGGDGK